MTDWDDYYGGREKWKVQQDDPPLWPWVLGAVVLLATVAVVVVLIAL